MKPPVESRALRVMRESVGVKKQELAELLGLNKATYYRLERGNDIPTRQFLERAADRLRLPVGHLDWTLWYLRMTDAVRREPGPDDPRKEREREREELILALVLEWQETYRSQMRREEVLSLAYLQRQAAPVLRARLRPYRPTEAEAVVRESEVFRSWALSELICHESIEAAADDADEALGLARLAVHVADCLPETEPLRARIQGYARAHLGNAIRVKGRLPDADEEFRRAKELWAAGAPADPERLLNEARVLGMEASLRRSQGRFAEALHLIDIALNNWPGAEVFFLRLNRATVLEQMGRFDDAVALLRELLDHRDLKCEPRLVWTVQFNIAVNLCHGGHFGEAESLVKELKKLALRLRFRLGALRLDWLRGWAAAGLRRFSEAETLFREVRREFLARDIPYDAALISLELAVLFMAQGENRRAKEIAAELGPVFQAQRVSREALASLSLFCRAVESDDMTIQEAQKCLTHIRSLRAQ